MNLKLLSASKLFFAKNNAARIEKILHQRKVKPSKALEYVMPSNIKVTAVQIALEKDQTFVDLVASFCSIVDRATQAGSQLICFPEFAGMLPLLTSKPFYEELYLFSDDLISERENQVGASLSFYLRHIAHPLWECSCNLFGQLAAGYRVYILAGTMLVKTKDGLVNRGMLFGPDGKLILEQDKLHLTDQERMLGVKPGNGIQVADTVMGKVSILIGKDQRVFETAKAAHSQGAQILLCPSGLSVSESSSFFQSCAFMRCQEQSVFAVSSWLTGDFMDLPFRAISGIYAPFAASKLGNGVIVQSDKPKESACMTARIDLDRLGKDVDLYKSDMNPKIEELLRLQYTKPRQPPVLLTPESEEEEEEEERAAALAAKRAQATTNGTAGTNSLDRKR